MPLRRKEIDPWAGATWEGAESEVLARGAAMTLAERLRWLEETSCAARALMQRPEAAEEIAESDATRPAVGSAAELSLLELLAELGGVELEEHWSDPTVVAGLLRVAGGRRIVVVERTYRDGIVVLLDPTEAELAAGRAGCLWELWNSERAHHLAGAI